MVVVASRNRMDTQRAWLPASRKQKGREPFRNAVRIGLDAQSCRSRMRKCMLVFNVSCNALASSPGVGGVGIFWGFGMALGT